MINFILPQLYHNTLFNRQLFNYLRAYPERTNFSERINLFCQKGNFPYSFWNGDINTNLVDKHIVLYSEAMRYYLDNDTLIMLDFSNVRLLENDLWIQDPHVKMILNVFKNKGHLIKVISSKTKEIISKNYPGYDYIIKDTGVNNYDSNDFVYISMDINKPIENNQNKIFYPIFNKCINCEKYNNCREIENLQQFTFSEFSTRSECNVEYPWNPISLKEEILTARKKGYRFFEFGDISVNFLPRFNEMLIELLIKPEYQNDFKWGEKND